MHLAYSPEKINSGEVVRGSQENLELVACFDAVASDCRIGPACMLKGILSCVVDEFFANLEPRTLADLPLTKCKRVKLLAGGARRACACRLE